jgi:hypothetical protein
MAQKMTMTQQIVTSEIDCDSLEGDGVLGYRY